jgi:hypothetical protein
MLICDAEALRIIFYDFTLQIYFSIVISHLYRPAVPQLCDGHMQMVGTFVHPDEVVYPENSVISWGESFGGQQKDQRSGVESTINSWRSLSPHREVCCCLLFIVAAETMVLLKFRAHFVFSLFYTFKIYFVERGANKHLILYIYTYLFI